MARFFIDRPIFAWVISIVIMLAGSLAVVNLPISQYPEIAPPSIRVTTLYRGASASTIESNVVQVIEENMTGLDNFLYMKSESTSAGMVFMTLTFESGTNPDIAQVQVQNKLQRAISSLPQAVQQEGVRVEKSSSTFLMMLSLVSPDGSLQNNDLGDFMITNLRDPISRLEGVGSVQVFGGRYAMRVWLDPYKLNSHQLTPMDVVNAISVQNSQVTVGALGGAPAVPGQQTSFTLMSQLLMTSIEQFEEILLKVNQDGSQVRLQDVATLVLGSDEYNTIGTYAEGGRLQPSAGMAIMLGTGANALETSDQVREKVDELAEYFPPGVKAIYPYDTTTFVKISIKEVAKTLVEAIILVFLVMYLFLQSFRATLVPTIAVPVVLLGTFGIMSFLGFSINTLTMFGLVLAIGLLVDDAIVVVENVERVMQEEGLPPREATQKSMDQITGALIGIAVVLSAVFVPMAFMGGSTGEIYRQFSVTIVSAMALSVLVALTLSPALCATLLKPVRKGEHHEKKGFFGWFNRSFDRSADKYRDTVQHVLARPGRGMTTYLALLTVMVVLFLRLPTAFIPEEDQGVFLTMVQLPAGASLERTRNVQNEILKYYTEEESENINAAFAVAGFSFAGMAQNMGMVFTQLKDWSERPNEDQSVDALVARATQRFGGSREAMIFAFNLPAVPALGTATGFDFFLQDRAGHGHEKLLEARNQFLGLAMQNPNLVRVRPNGMDDVPEYHLDIDYEQVMAQGVSIADINRTLSIAWGSGYVNDFLYKGRVKKVFVQSDAKYRMAPEDVEHWYVRNNSGAMVPISAVSGGSWSYGSPRLERYNSYPAMEIVGEPAPGKSSGEAMQIVDDIMKQLPEGFGYEWTATSFQEQRSGAQAPFLYAISLLVVFLCLAALYESWTVPFSVMLSVPLGVLGALAATYFRGLENDVYFQVGLLTTIGLSAKNAILIVEFAKRRVDKGRDVVEATVRAARQRLRPILMTSLAFVFGVLPLAISTGAGANARHAIGTGVVGGMLSATFLAIVFVPIFYVVVVRTFTSHGRRKNGAETGNQRRSEAQQIEEHS
ncbi:MAG: efflux RND transporter permease subunit [bacterium]|nr:efflux RND transporter permease subunit [bacterium]